MDKNKIKSFAVWARRNLIAAVTDRAFKIGIEENNIQEVETVQGGFKLKGKEEIFNLSVKDRDTLVDQIKEKGFQQVMEEVAYTWFNRFMGLRYMEINEYLPTGIRVLSSEVEGKTEPDVLTRVSEVIDELSLKGEYIYELLDSGKTEDREEAYKHILVKQCNELGKIIPQMFERISDYTELLLPDNLLEEGSVIRKMVEDIEEDDWKKEVEIIGWMYQYYISEKKDEVFAALKNNVKITKENIPAATQLFTPKWIVKYMVENSLGRLWIEGHPNQELQKEWKYYLEEAQQESEVGEELKKIREEHSKLKPEDIKVLDPCMGSGHILVYAFDVLYQIYKTAGYSEREIPRMILQNNLYGLDIDDRAAQLASFALIMKARHYNRRLFREIEREKLDINLCSIQESNGMSKEAIDYFVREDKDLKKEVEYLIDVFNDAKEYGSILEVESVNFGVLNQRLKEIEQEENLMFSDYKKILLDKIPIIIKQTEIMSRKYDVSVTNPPYMGRKGMDDKLSSFIDERYLLSNNDLFTVFIERGFKYVKHMRFNTTVTMQSWMYLSVYEKLREQIIKTKSISSLLHMGNMVMGIAFGTSATIFRNYKLSGFKGSYTNINIEDLISGIPVEFPMKDRIHETLSLEEFENIPSKPIAYNITKNVLSIYTNSKMIKDYGTTKTGMTTGDNDRFLRLWFEVNKDNIGFDKLNAASAMQCEKKWFPYSKGGGFRRWIGFNQYIINWHNNGFEIKNNINTKGKKVASVRSEDSYFRECITWSAVTSYKFSSRIINKGYLFDSGGSSLFVENNLKYFLGLLNSKLSQMFLDISNNTINYQPGDIARIPIIYKNTKKEDIDSIVANNISISKKDWDSFETSWNFKIHPLLKLLDKGEQYNLSAIYRIWETECEEAFETLKYNEEELNRIFIDIYGLQDELTPEVEEKDVTIRKADREIDIKSFVSYAVGCVLGRYSIDAEGLIYAGGEWNDKWRVENGEWRVSKQFKNEDGEIVVNEWVKVNFVPDIDNVIPITEDEYFEDDIVARFIDFVRTVYSTETLEDNLDFIADSIGRKASETARQAIRRYFIKDFYKDHLKVYQKRPIYWLFESGKNDGFKALIYMHRYNEQTVAKVRTDYLHMLQRKYEAEINRLQLVADSEDYTARDRSAAKKKNDRISKQIEECREYDQIVAHLANEQKSIDLDDGVKVNYDKFQGVKVINSKGKEVKMDLLAKI